MSRRSTHGHCRGGRSTPEYQAWQNMMRRCNNKDYYNYANYGGRGIRVSTRWHVFSAFAADMGKRPSGMTLERIDNDGDYEPENCVRATQRKQNLNTRRSRTLNIDGATKTLCEWADESGINYSTIRERLVRGWSPKDAVFNNDLSFRRKIYV